MGWIFPCSLQENHRFSSNLHRPSWALETTTETQKKTFQLLLWDFVHRHDEIGRSSSVERNWSWDFRRKWKWQHHGSEIPEWVRTLVSRFGFEVSTRSKMFPDTRRVTSLTTCTKEKSSIVSSRSWWRLARVRLVMELDSQSMSGRLKSPPMMMFGWLSLVFGHEFGQGKMQVFNILLMACRWTVEGS